MIKELCLRGAHPSPLRPENSQRKRWPCCESQSPWLGKASRDHVLSAGGGGAWTESRVRGPDASVCCDLRHDRVRATTKPFFTKKENGAEAAQPPARDPGPESTCALELSRICPTLPRQELARPCGDVLPMEPPVRTGCTELQHPDKES